MIRVAAGAALAAACAMLLLVTPGAAAGPPAGLVASSTWWTSAETGWLLGFAPCGDAQCPSLSRTVDGGQDWRSLPVPPLAAPTADNRARVYFADDRHGLLTDGQRLFVSQNGGLSWAAVVLAGARYPIGIGAVAGSRGAGYAVVSTGSGDDARTRLYAGTPGGVWWTPVAGVEVPGSVVGDIAAHGDAADVTLGTAFTANGYWTTSNGRNWRPAALPCPVANATRLAASGDTVFALCSHDPGMGAMFKDVEASVAGGPFQVRGQAPDAGITTGFAAVAPDVLAVTGIGEGAAWLHLGTAGGADWTTPLAITELPLSDLHFSDARHGELVLGGPPFGQAVVYRTADGGLSWDQLPLP